MRDRREEILARLVALAATVTGVTDALRNRKTVSETHRPCIVVNDGDEDFDEPPNDGRPARQPQLVHMSPEIVLMAAEGTGAAIGTALNTMRREMLRLIKTDDQLAGSVGSNGRIYSVQTVSDLSKARAMEGQMLLSLVFVYPLIVDEL